MSRPVDDRAGGSRVRFRIRRLATACPMRPADPMVFVLPASASQGSDSYDRRMCQNLPAVGQPVLELPIAGSWPEPDASSRTRLARSLVALPDRTVVLLDG